jgi:putative membrane protein
MNRLRMLALGVITLGSAAVVLKKLADERSRAPGRFVDAALVLGTAEIEAAKLALEKSSSVEVKAFAYEMIDEHTLINQHLCQLARNKGHEMEDDASRVSSAQDMLLNLRQAQDFDRAYARRLVTTHRRMLTMLDKATDLDDFEVSSFARRTLTKMANHMKMAQDLDQLLASGGPLKPSTGRDAQTDEGVWPVDRQNPEVREPQQGDTPKAANAERRADADHSGGMTPRAPAAGSVKQEEHPASPVSGTDTGLARGTPQQARGNPGNPHH